jgi:hypothetical protein
VKILEVLSYLSPERQIDITVAVERNEFDPVERVRSAFRVSQITVVLIVTKVLVGNRGWAG